MMSNHRILINSERSGIFSQRIFSASIPRAVRKLEFGQRESSRGSIDRKEVSINAIRASLRSSNPGALAQSKFQFVNGSGYRKLSSWIRGKIQDRVAFKALAEGFRHEQVNPAYGSQSCPFCEFVDQRNRIGDRFQCLHCRHENTADRIAALNYARRLNDPEIGLYTPYSQVK